MALDFPDQHPDRGRGYRSRNRFHRGHQGTDAASLRHRRDAACRARHRRPRLWRLGAWARFPPTACGAWPDGRWRICSFCYVLHARRTAAPVLDLSLLDLPTMRAAVLGGFIYRAGTGALPFLLPLLLQLGFRPLALSVRPDHLVERGGRDGNEDGRSHYPAATRIPIDAHRERSDQRGAGRGVRDLCARGLVCLDRGPAGRRRLFPLAAIHERQYDRVRGCGPSSDEPRDLAGGSCAAALDIHRRGGRRPCGDPHAMGSRPFRHYGHRLSASLFGHRRDCRIVLLCFARMPHDAGAELARRSPVGDRGPPGQKP